MTSSPTIEGPAQGQGQSVLCAPILRVLPAWFGIEEATQHYIEEIDRPPTFVATVDGDAVGFLSLKQHGNDVAETYLRAQGTRFLQVETLSAANPDEYYAKTRAFYRALGFSVLEEFPDLWDPGNPALQLIKCLAAHR
ncbi:MAG: hypothetical protein ACP5HG_12275 [Anaerolineae bacterium]